MQQRRRAAQFAKQPGSAVNGVTGDKCAVSYLSTRADELSTLVVPAAADSDLA